MHKIKQLKSIVIDAAQHVTQLTYSLVKISVFVLLLPAPALSRSPIEGFKITKSNGIVKQITLHLTNPNRTLILDKFTKIEEFIKDEKAAFSTPSHLDRICKHYSNPKNCEQTCYWASKARPFGRARLLSTTGKTLWTLDETTANKGDIKAYTGLSPGYMNDKVTSCLSPDRKFLNIASYFIDNDEQRELAGFGVLNITNKKFFRIVGKKTNEEYGHKRFTWFAAWQTNKPHTMIFEVTRPENNNQPIMDTGEPRKIAP